MEYEDVGLVSHPIVVGRESCYPIDVAFLTQGVRHKNHAERPLSHSALARHVLLQMIQGASSETHSLYLVA